MSSAAALGRAGAALAALTVPVVLVMHVLAPWSRVDPVRRTISEYALGPGGWLFDGVVLALALASVLVAAALVRSGRMRVRSAPALLVGIWAVALVLVVVFEKTNWSIGPSVAGSIHRYASLAGFVALPSAALLLTRGAGARAVRAWATGALATFAPLVVAILTAPLTGVPWWRAVPLGLLERVLAVAEVGVVVALGLWAAQAAATAAVTRAPGAPVPSRGRS